MDKAGMDSLLQEMIDLQQAKVLSSARRILPDLTTDDILQPNDFPDLENHPHFRYEEGILEGLRSVQMALRAS